MFEKLVIILVIAIFLTTFMNVEAKKQPSFKPTNKPVTKHSPTSKPVTKHSPTSKPVKTQSKPVKSPTNKPVKSSANKPVKNKDDDNQPVNVYPSATGKKPDCETGKRKQPTVEPSLEPSAAPSIEPTLEPISAAPSIEPSLETSAAPITSNAFSGVGLSNFLFACSNNGYITNFFGRAGWGLDQIGIICSDGTKPGSFGGPGGNGFDVSNIAGFTSLDIYVGGSAGLGGFILNHNIIYTFGQNRGPWQGNLKSNSCPPGKVLTAISGTYSFSDGSTTVQSLEFTC